MATITKNNESNGFYVAYNVSFDKLHFGAVTAGSTTYVNLDTLETFETEAELETRIDEIKGSGWYNDNKIVITDTGPNYIVEE